MFAWPIEREMLWCGRCRSGGYCGFESSMLVMRVEGGPGESGGRAERRRRLVCEENGWDASRVVRGEVETEDAWLWYRRGAYE